MAMEQSIEMEHIPVEEANHMGNAVAKSMSLIASFEGVSMLAAANTSRTLVAQ